MTSHRRVRASLVMIAFEVTATTCLHANWSKRMLAEPQCYITRQNRREYQSLVSGAMVVYAMTLPWMPIEFSGNFCELAI